jgi:dUTP pyrophosphatase
MQTIRAARLDPRAKLPTRKHPQDAGMDLYSLDTAVIPAHGFTIVPTGITLEIAEGYVGLIKPKGRSDHLLGSGVVDAGYQGEILIKVVNPYDLPIDIPAGGALGQLLLLPVVTPEVEEVSPEEIHPRASSRGGNGGIVDQLQAKD